MMNKSFVFEWEFLDNCQICGHDVAIPNGKIEYLESDIFIQDQSVVYTSGSGGLFKSGIPVGIYYKKTENENEKVKFFSKLSQLTFVKLVSFEEDKK